MGILRLGIEKSSPIMGTKNVTGITQATVELVKIEKSSPIMGTKNQTCPPQELFQCSLQIEKSSPIMGTKNGN